MPELQHLVLLDHSGLEQPVFSLFLEVPSQQKVDLTEAEAEHHRVVVLPSLCSTGIPPILQRMEEMRLDLGGGVEQRRTFIKSYQTGPLPFEESEETPEAGPPGACREPDLDYVNNPRKREETLVVISIRVTDDQPIDLLNSSTTQLGHDHPLANASLAASKATAVDQPDFACRELEEQGVALTDIEDGKAEFPLRPTIATRGYGAGDDTQSQHQPMEAPHGVPVVVEATAEAGSDMPL